MTSNRGKPLTVAWSLVVNSNPSIVSGDFTYLLLLLRTLPANRVFQVLNGGFYRRNFLPYSYDSLHPLSLYFGAFPLKYGWWLSRDVMLYISYSNWHPIKRPSRVQTSQYRLLPCTHFLYSYPVLSYFSPLAWPTNVSDVDSLTNSLGLLQQHG